MDLRERYMHVRPDGGLRKDPKTDATIVEVLTKRAKHETLHACLAVHFKMEVEAVTIWPTGKTTLLWPTRLDRLYTRYMRDPLGTVAAVRQVAAVLLAPHYAMGARLAGADLTQLTEWRRTWEVARRLSEPEGPPWDTLRTQACADVTTWLFAYGRGGQLQALTQELLNRYTIPGGLWVSLVQRFAPQNPLAR